MARPALLFDFDDLMVNSAPLHVEATQQAFARFGIACEIPEDFKATLYGRRIPDVTDLLCEYLQVTIDRPAYLQLRSALFRDLVRRTLEPMPGLDGVTALTRQLALPHALASSGDRDYLVDGLQRLGLTDFFPVIVSGDEVAAGKPDPTIFLTAAARLGVAPAECVVLEDAMLGVEAAKRAGMRVIGVRNPYSVVKQDLARADCIVDHLGQITARMIGA